MWFQILGKIRMAETKWVNHAWGVTLFVTARGLTTSIIHAENLSYSLDMDFIDHALIIEASDGKKSAFPLRSESVAAFHARCSTALTDFKLQFAINEIPNEVAEAIPFSKDVKHCHYDPAEAQHYWRALLQADRLMKIFRADFIGKASPVHFFWGGNDLAVTRFSGRRAPEHPGGFPHSPDLMIRDAYSHEVSSCGFWPGDARYPNAAFFSYAYPMPKGFDSAKIKPKEAFFHPALQEYILPYEAVRTSSDPDSLVLDFFQSTYEAAANLGNWDRESLEESKYLKAMQEKMARAS